MKVVIPTKDDASTSDSARSSLGIPSADGTTGCNTPATSVGAAADSDTKKPRVRVNASARAQQLRSTVASRRASQRGIKRPIAAVTDEDQDVSDAALAHSLQMAEYETPPPKKQRAVSQRGRGGKKFPSRKPSPQSPESTEEDHSLSLSPMSVRSIDLLWSPEDSDATEAEAPGSAARRIPHRLNNYASSEAEPEPDENAEADEDVPLSWEEQRKARRVSLETSRSSKKLANVCLGGSRSKEAGEEAPKTEHHVG